MLEYRNNINKQSGAGLIEVLTSMLVLSVGVLGMVSVQSKSVQFNQGSMFESKAAILAADIMDRMRANPSEASRYQIGLNDSSPSHIDCAASTADCDPGELARFDVATWRTEIATAIPQGSGEITELAGPGGMSVYTITIQYEDGRLNDASSFGQNNESAPKQLVFQTAI